jgi:predicted nucleic acid-binding protein
VKILFDTSVLVAALLTNHSKHSQAFPSLEAVQRRENQGYISAHSLAELYSVLTRLPEPLRVSPDEAQALIVDLSGYLAVVSLQSEDYKAAISQMVALKLPGGGIFDALIAQAALKAKVNHLLTLNAKDFTRLSEEIALLLQVPE